MIFEGDTHVIGAIQEKRRLIHADEPHNHLKPLLFIDGGLMKGAYGVGAGLALEKYGYADVFSNVVGVSSGAPLAAYFLSGGVKTSASMLWEEFCDRKFINFWRFWNQVSTDYFKSVLLGSTGKPLDTARVLAAASRLHIAVSDFKTATPHLLRPHTSDEVIDAIQASVLMPNVSSDVVHFNDIRYVDGGFTQPHALRVAIDDIQATHVLVITNQDKIAPNIPRLERFLNNTLYRHRMPKPLRFAAHERKRERMRALEYMEHHYHTPYALVWGNGSIQSFERSPKKVQSVVDQSYKWWVELLEGAEKRHP